VFLFSDSVYAGSAKASVSAAQAAMKA
jgi:hypothetical protein